jgi:hypothetical protein
LGSAANLAAYHRLPQVMLMTTFHPDLPLSRCNLPFSFELDFFHHSSVFGLAINIKGGRKRKAMELVNLTPHSITIKTESETINLPVSGYVARLDSRQEGDSALGGVPVITTCFEGVTGLPDPEPGKVYIVSSLVAQFIRRPDVVAPDTGPTAIRQDGQIVAVTRLQRFA